jgi:putative oxidoreductase
MTSLLFLLARAGLAALFIVAGIGKFTSIAGTAGMLAGKGFPQPMLFAYAVATVELVGGLLVLIGIKARWAAVVLLLFTAGTIVLSHAFWGMDGAARAMNQTQALKNLAIMGGLLMLAVVGPGRYSVDRG